MGIALSVLLMLVAVVLWALNLVGLPGNWLLIVLTAFYSWGTEDDLRRDIGWAVVGGMIVLAVIGELLEFAAGALGATQAGGSKRGASLAILGSLVGGILGLFLGAAIPVPVVGSVIGALLCASAGAMAGAMLGEHWKGRDLDSSLRVGQAAFWGRLWGSLGKLFTGVLMLLLLLIALIF